MDSDSIQEGVTPHAANAELEQRLADSTRLLEATGRELEAFGAALSHDLRAPLRSIEGFSQLLLQQHAQQLDATGKDYLDRIHRASLRLGGMMEELLKLVRVARDGVKSERVDLSRMAQEILAGLRAAAPARETETQVCAGIVVTGDARLLRICMENLLGNAWKFTGKVPLARIFFGVATEDGVRSLCVRDNGAGFDQKYSDRLFRAFHRLHSEREFEGSGMGLATVQRILHAHGGRIWARAERDLGAAFYFTLPGMSATTEERQ